MIWICLGIAVAKAFQFELTDEDVRGPDIAAAFAGDDEIEFFPLGRVAVKVHGGPVADMGSLRHLGQRGGKNTPGEQDKKQERGFRSPRLNHGAMGDGGVLGNDDDAVPDVILLVVHLLRFAER